MSESGSLAAIPTIRLDEGLEEDVVSKLRDACINVGFFYLQGHGISSELLQRVFQQSKLLFDLDVTAKKQLSDPVISRGYTAMEEETLDPAKQTRPDTKEGMLPLLPVAAKVDWNGNAPASGCVAATHQLCTSLKGFYIGTDIGTSDPRYNPAKLRGPNQWPTPEVAPGFDCTTFRSTMEEYFRQMKALAMRVVQLLALSLNLPATFFDDSFLEPIASIRLLHYAPVPSKPEDGVFACGAHTDYGMITLLLTDDNRGLRILTKDNVWIDAPPMPDTYVVNLGDMLERWTNGLFRSTLHRVLTAGNRHRYSVPFFFEPTFETVVTCLEGCCSDDNPPKYPPTTAGEHLVSKYKQTHADFRPKEQ